MLTTIVVVSAAQPPPLRLRDVVDHGGKRTDRDLGTKLRIYLVNDVSLGNA